MCGYDTPPPTGRGGTATGRASAPRVHAHARTPHTHCATANVTWVGSTKGEGSGGKAGATIVRVGAGLEVTEAKAQTYGNAVVLAANHSTAADRLAWVKLGVQPRGHGVAHSRVMRLRHYPIDLAAGP